MAARDIAHFNIFVLAHKNADEPMPQVCNYVAEVWEQFVAIVVWQL
jgi:hypothetical protein